MLENKLNKIGKFLLISIISLSLIFIYTTKVKADSGFDSSWDSGGSYDSGSSYSSDSGSYSSDRTSGGGSVDPVAVGYTIYFFASFLVYFIVASLVYPNKSLNKVPFLFTSFCIILNGLISYLVFNPIYSIIITNSLFGVLIANKVNLFINKIFSGQPLFRKEKEEIYINLDYQTITEQLPNLDINDFYNQTFYIYKEIQLAWMDNDIERVRSILSDEMFNTYKMQLETLKVKNQKNMMEDITLINVYITNINKNNDKEVIDVIMIVTCRDYLIDISTSKVLRGNKNKVWTYEYKLSYMRSVEFKNIDTCPNCGSKLKDGVSVKCDFCGAIINRETDKFILIDKKMIKQE